jgi:hypothetical protein
MSEYEETDSLTPEDDGLLSVAKAIYLEMGLKHAAENITLDQSWDMSPRYHAECIERARALLARNDLS